jgi:hypothetical protein
MDGQELVSEQTPVVNEQRGAPPSRLTIDMPGKPRASGFPVVVLGGVVLASLLSAIYFVKSPPPRSNAAASSIRSTEPSAASETSSQTPNSSSVADTRAAESAAVESLTLPHDAAAINADSATRQLRQTSFSAALPRAHLSSSPLGLTANDGSPVIVRLANGVAIKADEAWETREGFWYRQAGMVTFLKRSRVNGIEQFPRSTSNSAVSRVEEKNKKSDTMTAPNKLRIRRLEAADTKKQSRISSFLKVTGRILKKPFKL